MKSSRDMICAGLGPSFVFCWDFRREVSYMERESGEERFVYASLRSEISMDAVSELGLTVVLLLMTEMFLSG